MAFVENFDDFYNTSDFAETAVWTKQGGVPVNVVGIFDDSYFEDDGESVGMQGTQPRFRCPSSKVPDIGEDDAMQIKGIEYHVVMEHPNTPNPGESLIILKKR